MIFYKFAQSRAGSKILTWCLSHCSFLLPIKRLAENDQLIAFHHPRPSYPVHILLIPKKVITGIDELTKKDRGLLLEVMKTAQTLVNKMNLNQTGYRLVLNAGAYQEVPQLHFHLILAESTNCTKEH